MSAKVTFNGLDDLRAFFRNAPKSVTVKAVPIVDRRAQNAASAIRTAYKRGKTGNLKDRVTVAVTRGAFATSATVRSNAPHAALYEFGTGAENVIHPGSNRRTDTGANRGSTGPHPTVIPIAQRERRAMHEELVDLVKSEGFEVSGAL